MRMVDDDDTVNHPAPARKDMAAARTVAMAVDDHPAIVIPAVVASIVAYMALFDTDVSNFLVVIVTVGPSIVGPHVAAAGAVVMAFLVIPSTSPVVMAAPVMVVASGRDRFVVSRMPVGVNDAAGEGQNGNQEVLHMCSAFPLPFEFMPLVIDPDRTGHSGLRNPEQAVELFMGPSILTDRALGSPLKIGAAGEEKEKEGLTHETPP